MIVATKEKEKKQEVPVVVEKEIKVEAKPSKLKAKKPELVERRLKMLVYGKAGSGKTTAAIQFPQSVIVDLEHGTDSYQKTILANNSIVLHSLDPSEIKEELTTLLTEDHGYKTVIIDPITHYYNAVQEKWTRIFSKHAKDEKAAELQDFGMKFWGRVKAEYKALQRILLSLDMNVIIISHEKDVYGNNFNKIGTSYDAMRGEDYVYDFVFQLEKRGQDRIAIKIKERSEIGDNKFPDEFPWSYQNFLKYYGQKTIEKKAEPKQLATKEQVAKITQLLEIAKIEDETVEKWFNKEGVDEWAEFSFVNIQKCIDFINKRLGGIK